MGEVQTPKEAAVGLHEKSIVITGGGSGTGAEVGRELAGRGVQAAV
jgi:hypothetical protein